MSTDIQLCSRALVMIGANPITALDGSDTSTEATVAIQIYETAVKDLLSRSRWRFAAKQQLPRGVRASTPVDALAVRVGKSPAVARRRRAGLSHHRFATDTLVAHNSGGQVVETHRGVTPPRTQAFSGGAILKQRIRNSRRRAPEQMLIIRVKEGP